MVVKLRIKAKSTSCRGTIDQTIIFEALENHWPELQQALEQLPQDEKDAFREHFNNAIEGEDDLGEILFQDHETFKSRIAYLDPTAAEEYAQEILLQEVLDKETLEEHLEK